MTERELLEQLKANFYKLQLATERMKYLQERIAAFDPFKAEVSTDA